MPALDFKPAKPAAEVEVAKPVETPVVVKAAAPAPKM